jgi:hypothetical protein
MKEAFDEAADTPTGGSLAFVAGAIYGLLMALMGVALVRGFL